MKITLLLVGKTSSPELKALTDDYTKRIGHYLKLEEVVIESAAGKISDKKRTKELEGEMILKKLTPSDQVILLDDKGREFNSLQFAQYLDGVFFQSPKNICFVAGGAYGFSDEVYKRANARLSLSKLTFSHQIVRVIFLEQLYRAFTILHNHPYHHE